MEKYISKITAWTIQNNELNAQNSVYDKDFHGANCHMFYVGDELTDNYLKYDFKKTPWAQTLMTAMDVIRDKHNMHITTKPYITEEGIRYCYEIYGLFPEYFRLLKTRAGYDTNEEAIDDAIRLVYSRKPLPEFVLSEKE